MKVFSSNTISPETSKKKSNFIMIIKAVVALSIVCFLAYFVYEAFRANSKSTLKVDLGGYIVEVDINNDYVEINSIISKLFETETELPLDRQIYLINQEEIGTPSMENTLEKGSVLYIPRGLVHGSFATSSHSLHLTIGVRPLLADEYLKTCIDVLSEQDAELRQSILGKDCYGSEVRSPCSAINLIKPL